MMEKLNYNDAATVASSNSSNSMKSTDLNSLPDKFHGGASKTLALAIKTRMEVSIYHSPNTTLNGPRS